MKPRLTCLAASAAALVITAGNLQAKDEPDFYAIVDAGGSLQQNININGISTTFNPGYRADIGFGYNVCRGFAAEFEAGSIWNSLDKIGGVPLTSKQEGNLFQYPFLAKAIFKLPLDNGLTPYIGGGIGGVGGTFHLKDEFMDDSSSDFAFAYSGEAGLRYAINDNMEVGIGYKFLGSTGYKFFHEALQTGDSFNHSIFASFAWSF
jgi:opacity protein-like surface antigen